MNTRISCAAFAALAFVNTLNAGGGAAPPSSIPTFSTADIARQGHFYVGGHFMGDPGKETWKLPPGGENSFHSESGMRGPRSMRYKTKPRTAAAAYRRGC